tara:strand:- start:152 stop:877 length:726 start_codon:yes stop_codon:yes gene_type:complete
VNNFIYIFVFLFICNLSFANDVEILSDIPGNGLDIEEHYKVTVNYRGFLENGIEFDSSFKRNQPFIFQIGLRQVIPGWEIGLRNIRVGGKRKIKIPPNLAYGAKGVGKLIPPNSTLIFEIEVINATPPSYKKVFPYQLSNKKTDGFKIIDIRTLKEREETGIIKGSLEMTAFDNLGNFNSEFVKFFEKQIKPKDHVIFVSKKGDISSILANGFVEQLGKKNIYTLVGGIEKWILEGRKLKK